MQYQPLTTVPPAQYGQGQAGTVQSWQPVPYPVQQGGAQQATGDVWNGYRQYPLQAPVVQPQPYTTAPQYQPVYPGGQLQYQQPVPQYSQPYQPVPQYQPYQPAPQYQPAPRPWGTQGSERGGTVPEKQSIDTWQMPGQYQGWGTPSYDGYQGQYGAPQNGAAPGYYW